MNNRKALLVVILFLLVGNNGEAFGQIGESHTERVIILNEGWRLVSDLRIPDADPPFPTVLMANKAAGDRTVYLDLGRRLAERGVASLALDLRGHGESVNLGHFVPGEVPRSPLIWDSESDILAAQEYLELDERLDATRLGMVAASYSGEESAEAGRIRGYASAYVLLSPGSLSDTSILAMDSSGVPWLFIASKEERFLQEITAAVQTQTRSVELILVPGASHATDLLQEYPDLADRNATWLTFKLQ